MENPAIEFAQWVLTGLMFLGFIGLSVWVYRDLFESDDVYNIAELEVDQDGQDNDL